MTGWRLRCACAASGLALDRLVGDPPDRAHPVAWFGRAMAWHEGRSWQDDRRRGVRHLAAGITVAAVPTALLCAAARRLGGVVAECAAATTVVATVVGARSLEGRATEIADALGSARLADARLADARRLLPTLVGRDPAGLDEREVARAVVESVAENTVDAVVAPLFWAAVGGPVAASTYRAVNTLDAMVGHRHDRYRRYGWASARADDVANYLPARLAAVMVALCAPTSAGAVFRAVRRQAPAHPSPNAGVVEAAFAAALGLRLGGDNRYAGVVEQRGELGEGRPAAPADIARAVRLARRVLLLTSALLLAPWLAIAARARRTDARRSRSTP